MEKTIIEVNGVKLEVDLRTAKRIDTLQVGDRVRVLTKESGKHQVYHGTVIGFEPFENLPTIIVCYLEKDYWGAKIKFLYYNAQSTDVELIASIDNDQLAIEKSSVLKTMDSEIQKKRNELDDLEAKRGYFLDNFRAYFGDVAKVDPGQVA